MLALILNMHRISWSELAEFINFFVAQKDSRDISLLCIRDGIINVMDSCWIMEHFNGTRHAVAMLILGTVEANLHLLVTSMYTT